MGLLDVYGKMGKIQSVLGTPMEKIALMRLMVCITQAALNGPSNEKGWRTCKKDISSKSIKYLKGKKKLFDLYGDRPFLQIRHLSGPFTRDTFSLKFTAATGNNHMLHDLHARDGVDRELPDNEIASYLVQTQLFAECGRKSAPSGELRWGKKAIQHYNEAAPLNGRLVTIVYGDSLLDTIYLNLVTKDELNGAKIPFGVPVWDLDIKSQQDSAAVGATRTYLYNLVPASRAILLNRSDKKMIYCEGIKRPDIPHGKYSMPFIDPWLTLIPIKEDKERMYLKIISNKYPWRDLCSLLALLNLDKTTGGPWAFRHLRAKMNTNITIYTGGIEYSNANPIIAMEWHLVIPAEIFRETSLTMYANLVKSANDSAISINIALKMYKKLMEGNKKSSIYDAMLSEALKVYWDSLNRHADILIRNIDNEEAQEEWLKTVHNTAKRCFEQVCTAHPSSGGTHFSNFVEALSYLIFRLNKMKEAA